MAVRVNKKKQSIGRLADRAFMVDLDIHRWNHQKQDRRLSEEACRRYNTEGVFIKALIGKKHLEDLNKALNKVDKVHKHYTLPWSDDGWRVVATSTFQAYEKAMQEAISAVDEQVEELASRWPALVRERSQIDKTFDRNLYPPAAALRHRYRVTLKYRPIPEGQDLRVDLSDSMLTAIRANIDKDQQDRLQSSVFEIVKRIQQYVGRMAERLGQYKPADDTSGVESAFRDSLILNVRELAEMIPHLNITGDIRIEKIGAELAKLTAKTPTQFRADAALRQRTVKAADRILKKMDAFV